MKKASPSQSPTSPIDWSCSWSKPRRRLSMGSRLWAFGFKTISYFGHNDSKQWSFGFKILFDFPQPGDCMWPMVVPCHLEGCGGRVCTLCCYTWFEYVDINLLVLVFLPDFDNIFLIIFVWFGAWYHSFIHCVELHLTSNQPINQPDFNINQPDPLTNLTQLFYSLEVSYLSNLIFYSSSLDIYNLGRFKIKVFVPEWHAVRFLSIVVLAELIVRA